MPVLDIRPGSRCHCIRCRTSYQEKVHFVHMNTHMQELKSWTALWVAEALSSTSPHFKFPAISPLLHPSPSPSLHRSPHTTSTGNVTPPPQYFVTFSTGDVSVCSEKRTNKQKIPYYFKTAIVFSSRTFFFFNFALSTRWISLWGSISSCTIANSSARSSFADARTIRTRVMQNIADASNAEFFKTIRIIQIQVFQFSERWERNLKLTH